MLGAWILVMSGAIAMALHVALVAELKHGLSFRQSLHNVLYFAQLSPTQNMILPVAGAGALSVAFSIRVLPQSTEDKSLWDLLGRNLTMPLTPLLAGFVFSTAVVGLDYPQDVVVALPLAATAYLVLLAPLIVLGGGVILLGYRLVDCLVPATEG